jgi:nitroimidazol reductase NimA-like FMN-containing flavoprotein (pyridoxamine 5'-phosphate oxidase superfamily)
MRLMLIHMERDECEERLASTRLGRLGVVVEGRPEIFPVLHAFDPSDRTIVFQTNERTKLHAALDWPWAAFEVDALESEDGSKGWSVLVVGRAEEITDPSEVARVAKLGPLWTSSDRVRWIRIVPDKITGRRADRATPSPS